MPKSVKKPAQPTPKRGKAFNILYPVLIVLLLIVAGIWVFLQNSTPTLTAPAPVVVTAPAPVPVPAPAPVQASMVDEQQCQGCHSAQVKDWQGSHHQMAMQAADEHTVLANFKDQHFTAEGETTRFFRKDQAFWVNTPGADGKPADFKVAYTFGVAPLQQYLIEVPGGRLQALGVAWDTQKNRWFHLYPGQGVNFKSPLHWSKPGQNANFMCVECHTTGYKRDFDPASNSFASHWNSLGVGCQACHGPASKHLEWAAKPNDMPNFGFAVNLKDKDATTEIETCARCHGRRAPLGDGYHADKRLMDDYLPSTLTRELYALDGKIQDEVFEHGSFLQSKMFDKGVRCSNCHNPHSTELKAAGNGVCLQCHNPSGKTTIAGVDGAGLKAKNYDSPEHHKHQMGQPGSQCVDCHMPGKFYMVNDYRHDHSFSLPNPERALKLGTPDACLGCHQGTAQNKTVEQFKLWYASNTQQPERYDESLWLIRNGKPGAAQALFDQLTMPKQPAIRRATLLTELANYPSQRGVQLASDALRDPAPQVREVAVNALAAQTAPEQRSALLGPLLSDPVLAVRIASARALLGTDAGQYQAAFDKAIGEYETVQLSLQERAEANLNLAQLYQANGNPAKVEPYLRAAIVRDPDFMPALVTLVQWLDAQQRTDESWQLLTTTLAQQPKTAVLQFTKGLALIRRNKPADALAALQEAHRLEPGNQRFAYVLGLTLQDQGDLKDSRQVLEATLREHPENRDVRLALVSQLRDNGEVPAMKNLIDQLKAINPGDPILGGH